LAANLLEHFDTEIETLTLIPSDGGRYEVTVNGKLIYSKEATGRHADPGEVEKLFQAYLQEGKQ